MSRVLVVEDNADLAYGLRNNLELEGYTVRVAGDGGTGLDLARRWMPDLVVLDLMLPGTDGFRILRELRSEGRDMPILLLTARGEEADKVRGLKLGADDYVTKPFGLLELLARVEALLRRASGPAETVLRFGRIVVKPSSRTVSKEGRELDLAPKELDLLLALLRRRGAAVSRLELLEEVWGYSDAVISRTVDTHVAALRKKIEDDPTNPRYLLTVRKFGYRLEPGP
ncbi:MAG: response regulator transcription factor [Thermoanaerobaculia bacterium]|nr:response regulator transcription factor [Thermoanaerobaculia bacterium]